MSQVSRIVALFAILTSTACATIHADGPPAEYGPEDKLSQSRSGTVSYNPNGVIDIVQQRRKDAFKRIYEFCGSRKYKITKEETKDAEDVQAELQGIANFGADKLKLMHFQCL